MINMIKMDLYRMFKTKSLYVIWMIMSLSLLFTAVMAKIEDKEMMKEMQNGQKVTAETEEAFDTTENMNLGIVVASPTSPGEKITVYDLIFANTQGKPIALFIAIFAVLFSTSDINNGYIKNIAGQISRRGRLIAVKALSLLVYTVFSFGIAILSQAVWNRIVFGYLEWGDGRKLLLYLGTEIMLHFALAVICMAIAVVLKSNVISMIIAVCMCMNVMMILYEAVDKLISRIGIRNFDIMDYSVSGKISFLSMNLTDKESVTAICLSTAYIIIMTAVCSVIFEKRDI